MSTDHFNLDDYQLLYGRENHGADSFCVKIFVKMSARKLDDEDNYGDASKAIHDLERALRARTAQLDPKGAAQRAAYQKEIEDIYSCAGVKTIYVEPIQNGYCSDPCCFNKPWFRVTSSIGHVVIGWRKSVISIDWKDTIIKKRGDEISKDKSVTYFDTGTHAWGGNKAVEYILELHR